MQTAVLFAVHCSGHAEEAFLKRGSLAEGTEALLLMLPLTHQHFVAAADLEGQ